MKDNQFSLFSESHDLLDKEEGYCSERNNKVIGVEKSELILVDLCKTANLRINWLS